MVRYPHEKLDPKHTQSRDFDSVEFNMLIAGELEIVCWDGISSAEHKARTKVARTLCYHKKYLNDGELRAGYDAIMKKIEQGKTEVGGQHQTGTA